MFKPKMSGIGFALKLTKNKNRNNTNELIAVNEASSNTFILDITNKSCVECTICTIKLISLQCMTHYKIKHNN